MTVYPAKDRKENHTGSWVADVQQEVGFARVHCDTYQEARRAERLLKAGHPAPSCKGEPAEKLDAVSPPPSGPYNLGQLAVDARQRLVGTKDEKQSAQRLVVMVRLIGPSLDIKTIRYAHLERAAKALLAADKNPKTVNRYMAAISGALRWAVKNDLLDRMPLVPRQKEGRGRIQYLPEGADDRLLTWMCENGRGRQALIFEVLVSTGLRIGELLALEPHEIEAEWLHLPTSKNDDARDVPIDPELSMVLRSLIVADAMPSYETVRSTFADAGKAVGVTIHFRPHVLRHTAATRLNAANIPTATIKEFMGHRSVATTLLYAHVSHGTLKEAGRVLRPPRR